MSGKKADGKSGGVMGWISTACHFAADRNDFRRFVIIVVNDVTQTVMLLLRSTPIPEVMFKCILLNILPASVVIPFVSLLQESPCKPGFICCGCLGRKKPLRFRPNVSSANYVAPDQQLQKKKRYFR